MVSIGRARLSDRGEVEKLIAEYHTSEGLIPRGERIAWAVDQQLLGPFPSVVLLARDGNIPVGVALAVYTPSAELGRIMTVNDFFVKPSFRRKGAGREMAKRLVEECRLMRIDEIDLEVISGNKAATAFWRSVGFEPADRGLFKLRLAQTSPSPHSTLASLGVEIQNDNETSTTNQKTSRLERSRRAVDHFTSACMEDRRIIAAFLGGSLASGTADEQSDIDVYLVTRKGDYETFFAQRELFLRSWGGIVWWRDVRNFEGLGFDLIQFIMEDGVDGDLALAHEENALKTHGGSHIVLVDKVGLLKNVKFPLLDFEDVMSREDVEKALADFWMGTRNAIKSWTRGRWWEAAESLANMRKRCRSFARIVHADDSEERLAMTFTSLDPDEIAKGINAAVDACLIWAAEAAKRVGVTYPVQLARLTTSRVLAALEKPDSAIAS